MNQTDPVPHSGEMSLCILKELKQMKQRDWTIMIYMAGDNNLSVDMAYALEQIKNVAGEGANLFVYYDGNSPSIPTLYCDFSEPNDPKYVPSFAVENKLYPVTQKHNENAADDKSVLNFVDWCVNKVEVDNNGEITNSPAAISWFDFLPITQPPSGRCALCAASSQPRSP